MVSNASKRPDTGVFWDEPLDLYLKGTINVNFYENVQGFYAGDTISGTIDVEIGEYFEATNLLIEFRGIERSHMDVNGMALLDRNFQLQDFHREVKEIVSMK